jgi:hypothetical protein
VKPRNKRISEKHYGLFHGPLRIEVENVTARHKKPCAGCEGLPDERRLKITAGSGRSAAISVYCYPCGVDWLRDHETELGRAIHLLNFGGSTCIRLIQEDADGD